MLAYMYFCFAEHYCAKSFMTSSRAVLLISFSHQWPVFQKVGFVVWIKTMI